MDVGTISSRYVKALFSLAKEKLQETRVYDDMKMLAVSFEQEPGLKVVLDNPIFPEEEKVKLLTTAAGLEVCDRSPGSSGWYCSVKGKASYRSWPISISICTGRIRRSPGYCSRHRFR